MFSSYNLLGRYNSVSGSETTLLLVNLVNFRFFLVPFLNRSWFVQIFFNFVVSHFFKYCNLLSDFLSPVIYSFLNRFCVLTLVNLDPHFFGPNPYPENTNWTSFRFFIVKPVIRGLLWFGANIFARWENVISGYYFTWKILFKFRFRTL